MRTIYLIHFPVQEIFKYFLNNKFNNYLIGQTAPKVLIRMIKNTLFRVHNNIYPFFTRHTFFKVYKHHLDGLKLIVKFSLK